MVEVGLTVLNVTFPEIRLDCVWTNVLPVLHVLVEDEYSLAV